jgi:hypothetical protein
MAKAFWLPFCVQVGPVQTTTVEPTSKVEVEGVGVEEEVDFIEDDEDSAVWNDVDCWEKAVKEDIGGTKGAKAFVGKMKKMAVTVSVSRMLIFDSIICLLSFRDRCLNPMAQELMRRETEEGSQTKSERERGREKVIRKKPMRKLQHTNVDFQFVSEN